MEIRRVAVNNIPGGTGIIVEVTAYFQAGEQVEACDVNRLENILREAGTGDPAVSRDTASKADETPKRKRRTKAEMAQARADEATKETDYENTEGDTQPTTDSVGGRKKKRRSSAGGSAAAHGNEADTISDADLSKAASTAGAVITPSGVTAAVAKFGGKKLVSTIPQVARREFLAYLDQLVDYESTEGS